jgi:hypothetical protein
LVAVPLLALAMIAALTSLALAEEQTRDSYVASVEPICKTNKAASDHYLSGVKSLVKQDKLKLAGTDFGKAASALDKAEKQLAAVPQPPADASKLNQWLSGIEEEVSLMRTIGKAFKSGDKNKGSSLAVKLQNNATKINNLVIPFGFRYCRIEPSQYT